MIEVKGYDNNVIIETPTIILKNEIPAIETIPIENRSTLGFTNPEGTVQFIGIPKNASTYIEIESTKQGWTFEAIPFDKKIIRIILLRDPYERYLSGLAEDIDRYLTINNDKKNFFQNLLYNDYFFDFFDFLFDAKAFAIEGHTQLQTFAIDRTINAVDKESIVYIKITNNLGDNLNVFLQGEGYASNFSNEKQNHRARNNLLKQIREIIERYFLDAKNFRRKQLLMEYLKPDYEFIKTVVFFNGR